MSNIIAGHEQWERWQDDGPGWYYRCTCGAEFYGADGYEAWDLWWDHAVEAEIAAEIAAENAE